MKILPEMSGAWYDPANPGWGVTLMASAAPNAVECGTLYAHDFTGAQCWFLLLPSIDNDGYDVVKPRGQGFPIHGESKLGPPVGKIYISGDRGRLNLTGWIARDALGLAVDFSPTPLQIEFTAHMLPLVKV